MPTYPSVTLTLTGMPTTSTVSVSELAPLARNWLSPV